MYLLIFENDNISVNKALNVVISKCSINNAILSVRKVSGINISDNAFHNSSLTPYTQSVGDHVTELIIKGNIFRNADGSTTRKAISVSGDNAQLRRFSICGNMFYNYRSHTIYFFKDVFDGLIEGNFIRVTDTEVNINVMLLRCHDVNVINNVIIFDLETPANKSPIFQCKLIRGSIRGNIIKSVNVTYGSDSLNGIFDMQVEAGQTQGAVIENNVVFNNVVGRAMKFVSSGDTIYTVRNNDFRYTNNPYNNPGLHLFSGNHLAHENIKDLATITALPTAGVEHRGRIRLVPGGAGVADVTYVCRKKADDTYEWKQIDL